MRTQYVKTGRYPMPVNLASPLVFMTLSVASVRLV
jgi:hypothetical protein